MPGNPVGILARGEPCLAHKGGEQAVGVVAEEQLVVDLHGGLQWAVEECDLFEVEMFGIDFALCRGTDGEQREECCQQT